MTPTTNSRIALIIAALISLQSRAVASFAKWSIPPAYSTPDTAKVPADFSIIDAHGVRHILYQSSHAVLLFEGEYEHPEAWASVSDAALSNETKLRTALEARGFQVEVWRDLKGSQLNAQLYDVFSRYGHLPEGRLFFYYFGHGYKMGQIADEEGPRTFLVPIDAPNPIFDRDGFLSKAMQISQLVEYARQATTKHLFFALEACKAGSIIQTLSGPEPIAPAGYLLSDELQRPIRQFLTAGSPERDVPAQGVFTETLIDGLANADINHDGYVTGTELMDYVALNVPLRAPGQHPEKGDVKQLGGDFVFGSVKPTKVGPVALEAKSGEKYALCSDPSNGLEKWTNSETWSADSNWRGGGSDPQSFCGSQKLAREAAFPERQITLVRAAENHRAKYNPFKHDEYRYTCDFLDQWNPIYKRARSAVCGLEAGR